MSRTPLARPFQLHQEGGRVLHGVEFPSGHVALEDGDACVYRMSLGHLLTSHPGVALWPEDLAKREAPEQDARPRLKLADLRAAVAAQHAMVFQNAAHTQYGITIACPECQQTTQWVEEKDQRFRMQPCGHQVPSDARQVVPEVGSDGYLRFKVAPDQ